MTKPVVLFGIVSYNGGVCREFLPNLIETLSLLGQQGIPSATFMLPGDPYLSKARNRVAYEFLVNNTNCTHLFFLDDDLGWEPAAALRLIEHDVDVVAGVYPKKSDKGEYPAQVDTDDAGNPITHGSLWKAKLAPTGFLCIKRHVLEKMAAKAGMYVDTTAVGSTTPQWNIFDMGWFTPDGERPAQQGGIVGQFWGEDYYFCRKWRDMGGDVLIDPDIMFTHRGSVAWAGNFRTASEQYFAKRDSEKAQAAAE